MKLEEHLNPRAHARAQESKFLGLAVLVEVSGTCTSLKLNGARGPDVSRGTGAEKMASLSDLIAFIGSIAGKTIRVIFVPTECEPDKLKDTV